MARQSFAFRYTLRVRWSETDAQGIVFNARYLDYADVAVTEYWRAVNWQALYPDAQLDFNIRKATVLFEAPIKPDEQIELMAKTVAVGRTSMTQIVEIHGVTADGSDDLRATIELVSVHVDLTTHRSKPLPDWVEPVFSAFDHDGTAAC
jgi:acyl-CoA thioester hydrolase